MPNTAFFFNADADLEFIGYFVNSVLIILFFH